MSKRKKKKLEACTIPNQLDYQHTCWFEQKRGEQDRIAYQEMERQRKLALKNKR